MRLLPLSLAGVVLILAFAGGGNAQSRPSYPKPVVEQYIKDCSAGRSGPAMTVCRCIINGIQMTYTYAEFQILNQQISQTGQTPPRLTEIIKTCRTRPNAFQTRS